MNALKWVGIVLAGLLLLLVLLGALLGGRPGQDGRRAAEGGPARPGEASVGVLPQSELARPAAIKVSAVRLHQDYEANEAAADDIYKSEQLEVTGSVASIEKDPFDNTIVWLRTMDDFIHVQARMGESAAAQAKSLRKGQKVVLSCLGGTRILGSPTIEDCALSL
ncbi:OB-fold protein [Chromobacterium alticapitis]|nr:hypothetical protein [Chromobacterium alticapitis]